VQTVLDECLAVFGRRGLNLPPPVVVADGWLGDSKLMTHGRLEHQGTLLVEGKRSYVLMRSGTCTLHMPYMRMKTAIRALFS
jgi:hypothetical protein